MTARKSKSAASPPLVGGGLGEVAWNAYSESIADGRASYAAAPWADLVEKDPRVAAAWCAVGQAVIAATISRKD